MAELAEARLARKALRSFNRSPPAFRRSSMGPTKKPSCYGRPHSNAYRGHLRQAQAYCGGADLALNRSGHAQRQSRLIGIHSSLTKSV